jgi:hypothetical protein
VKNSVGRSSIGIRSGRGHGGYGSRSCFALQRCQPRIDLDVPGEASAIEMRPLRFGESSLEDHFLRRMRRPGPSEHGSLGVEREEAPQRLPVSIPEFGASKAPADRPPSHSPHRGPPGRMEPDDGVSGRPDVWSHNAVVAIDHPRGMFVHEGCDSASEAIVGKWGPVFLMVDAVELQAREPECVFQSACQRALARATASNDGDPAVAHPIIMAGKPGIRSGIPLSPDS